MTSKGQDMDHIALVCEEALKVIEDRGDYKPDLDEVDPERFIEAVVEQRNIALDDLAAAIATQQKLVDEVNKWRKEHSKQNVLYIQSMAENFAYSAKIKKLETELQDEVEKLNHEIARVETAHATLMEDYEILSGAKSEVMQKSPALENIIYTEGADVPCEKSEDVFSIIQSMGQKKTNQRQEPTGTMMDPVRLD